MATQRLTIDGYGQLEINNCAFRRDGRVEAQCAPDSSDFSNKKVENGMLLAIDNVTRTVSLPTATSPLIGLVYSAEHLYDEQHYGLKDFALGLGDFLPRLGYLAVGDKFTTNCISYDASEFATDSALKSAVDAVASTAVYGTINSGDGSICLSATSATQGPVLKVVKPFTMPDGQYAVQLQVISA